MKQRLTILAAVAASAGLALLMMPEARAEMAKTGAQVPRVFGWHTYEVQTELRTYTDVTDDGRTITATVGGNVSYDRQSAQLDGTTAQQLIKVMETMN